MKLLSEESLNKSYANLVVPFFKQKARRGLWKTNHAVELVFYYAFAQNPKGVIVFSTGRTEASLKYLEILRDWYESGYSIFIHDHRGQGESSRLTNNRHHGYVERFEDYVEDFEGLIRNVLEPLLITHDQHNVDKVLLCHSMGSAIGYLLLTQMKSYFAKAVFSSPMFGFKTPIPEVFARVLLKFSAYLAKVRGNKVSYFFGNGNYERASFVNNKLTHSKTRFKIFNDLYNENKTLQLGGVTTQWITTSLNALERFPELAGDISTPCLILKSGGDEIVDNLATDKISERLSNAVTVEIADAKHELFFEEDRFRKKTMGLILDFIEDMRC